MADQASITAAFASIEHIDYLILAAIERYPNTIRGYDMNAAERLVRVKLVGYAEAVHQAIPKLASDASIILFGGIAELRPYPGSTMVTTVNAGITGLTTTLASELAPMRINAISPGLIIDTPSYENPNPVQSKALEGIIAKTPVKRAGTTADIVHAVLFLMDNTYVNGINLKVDGGLHLR